MKAKVLLLIAVVGCVAGVVEARTVACVGDSITYGAGIADRSHDSYPVQLERLLLRFDPAWTVTNFGVSGTTLLHRGDRPYISQSAYTSALASDPAVVIIKLGTNDSKPQNWVYKDEFVSDYVALIEVFRSLPSRPQVWICKPVPAFTSNTTIRPEVIRDEILPMIDETAARAHVPVIDLYTALLEHGDLFPDGIHPDPAGAGIIAATIAPYLTGVRLMPDFNDDGVVNLIDFAYLAQQWLRQSVSLDIAPAPTGDSFVFYPDLASLGVYWMAYPDLVTHWLFDETEGDIAADRLGGFDGVLQGAPTWQPTSGLIGGALELDGVNDCVRAETVLKPADGPFTVFAWVKGGAPGQVILSQADASGKGVIWLGAEVQSGTLMTALSDGGRGTKPLVSDVVVTDGLWHLVGVVWDGSHRFLYADGEEVAADGNALGNLRYSYAGFFLGAGERFATGTFWLGLVDDVRFYRQTLKP